MHCTMRRAGCSSGGFKGAKFMVQWAWWVLVGRKHSSISMIRITETQVFMATKQQMPACKSQLEQAPSTTATSCVVDIKFLGCCHLHQCAYFLLHCCMHAPMGREARERAAIAAQPCARLVWQNCN